MEGSGRGLIFFNYPIICLEELRKTTKNLSQDNQSLGRDLNARPPEYDAGVLTTRPWCLVSSSVVTSFEQEKGVGTRTAAYIIICNLTVITA
jgi:hypothetical protein